MAAQLTDPIRTLNVFSRLFSPGKIFSYNVLCRPSSDQTRKPGLIASACWKNVLTDVLNNVDMDF